MADNFEQLGFQVKVDGADSAVSNLDRIVIRAEKLGITINNNVKYYKREENQLKRNVKGLTSYLSKLTSTVVIARKFAHLVTDAVNESASYTENLVLFSTAFGKYTEEQLKWALGLADAYGLARNEVVKFAGTFRELASSLGIVGETADNVTRIVTNLGYDLSALYNTSVQKAMEKLQSGVFTGQTKPLRYFGVDISQASIDRLFETNKALAGLGVNARNLSQSDKVLARLLITMDSARNSFGTMALEINNLQSQFRIFQGSLSNFKLAVGNLVQEPLKDAIVYANAFIIALTNVVNAFAPKNKNEDTVFDDTTEGAEEASDAIDKLNRKLAGFDKFNVLGQGGESSSSIAVTEQLNELIAEQAKLYEEEVAKAMEEVKNKAVEMSKGIIGWFVKVDEEGNIVFEDGVPIWTANAKSLGAALRMIAVIIGTKIIASIGNFIINMVNAKNAIGGVWLGISLLITNLTLLITKWDDLSGMEKAIGILGAVASAALIAAAAIAAFHGSWTMGTATFAISGALVAIASSFALFSENLKDFGGKFGFADGGYTNANLIMTHENGKREWVGKAAGSSAIVNDTQMSDIMEVAVAKGVYNALSARSAMGGNVPTNETIVVKIGEEAVFNAVRKTARRQGRDFANV